MENHNRVCLNIDLSSPMPQEAYINYWAKLSKIEIRLVEKRGECKHILGAVYYY
jgi:hypothetical protein